MSFDFLNLIYAGIPANKINTTAEKLDKSDFPRTNRQNAKAIPAISICPKDLALDCFANLKYDRTAMV